MLQIAARTCGNLECLACWPDEEPCMPLDATFSTPRTSRNTGSAVELLELLTVADVAALLKVSKSWVYEHTRSRRAPRSDQLPHIKIGKYVRFDPELVRAFLDRRINRR